MITRFVASALRRFAGHIDKPSHHDFSLISGDYKSRSVSFTAKAGATKRIADNHPMAASSSDALRYAAYIQEARDRKDYVIADQYRKRVEGWGMKVLQTREATTVAEGYFH